jgi:magnesium transporter
LIRVLVYRGGSAQETDKVDPAWLAPDAKETLWVDIEKPDQDDHRLLSEVFKFHELAVDDAMAQVHHPKIETYDGVLYLILHGIASTKSKKGFVTRDIDFFLGRNYLVTVHHMPSRSLSYEREVCTKHCALLDDGPANLLHRIVDRMVDHYRPEMDRLEDRLEELERRVFERPLENPLREILSLKRDVASVRRVSLPQRDAVARLARREFSQIPEALAYRFRDVHDNLVRLADESLFMQDRVGGVLEAYLSMQSNRLNQVMKVLTIIATIFMPLTVLTGMFGMNVVLPHFLGGADAQFWWVFGVMAVIGIAMLWVFRRMHWL